MKTITIPPFTPFIGPRRRLLAVAPFVGPRQQRVIWIPPFNPLAGMTDELLAGLVDHLEASPPTPALAIAAAAEPTLVVGDPSTVRLVLVPPEPLTPLTTTAATVVASDEPPTWFPLRLAI